MQLQKTIKIVGHVVLSYVVLIKTDQANMQ